MRDAHRRAASLFLTLALGCAPGGPGSDSASSTSSSTPVSASESGSVTSAAEGSASATDSAPTSTGTPFTSGSSSTSEPCNFLSCEDYPKPECDNWAQDCPEGQKCAAYIAGGGSYWDAVKCVEVTGTDEPGDPCTSEGAASGVDSCIKGAMCWYVNQEGEGRCIALCTGSVEAPVCPPKSECAIAGQAYLNLCQPDCDPLLQDCANPAEVCYPINDTFTCAPDASGDEGQANDPCEFINVCDKGLMCADIAFVGMGCAQGSTGCCTPFCEFPDGVCPNPDQQCVQYFAEPFPQSPENAEHIGVCGVPG